MVGIVNKRFITRGEQALFNLEIKKKSGPSINPDIHHSKVPSSRLNIEPYSPFKATKAGFIFIWA